jgi:hypothetical protein
MIDEQANPPRLAQRLLQEFVPHRDADTIAGDLLEEYRLLKRPALGRRGADIWYIGQVAGVLGRLVWPFALALIVARSALAATMLFPLVGRWNPSLVPAPNVSLLEALLFLAAGYYGARRTGRIATGIVNAAALGLFDFALFAVLVGLLFPTVFAAIYDKPFIVLIGCTFLAIAMTFAVVFGALGAVAGRWLTPRSAVTT